MNTDQLLRQLKPYLRWIVRYRGILFFIALSVVYGYVITRINALNNVAPATPETTTANQVHVDPSVVSKIEQLQDNSVSVKSLFDQARDNPFQE